MREQSNRRALPVLAALGKSVCYLLLFVGMQTLVMLPASIYLGVAAALGGDVDALYAQIMEDAVTYTMISGLLTTAVVIGVYRFRRKPMAEALWLRGVDRPTLLTGAALAPALYLMVGGALSLLPEAWLESYNEASAGIDSGTLTGVLAVAVVAPVVEELIFRGLMLNRLSQVMPGWLAAALSSAAFGVCHVHPVWFAYAFVLGAFFAFLDLRAQSILPSILGHIAFNAISQILSFVPEEGEGAAMAVLVLVAIAAPILNRRGVAALFRRGPRQAALPAPDWELPTRPGTYEYDPWDE